MRRRDREITDSDQISEIISKCYCCRLAFSDDDGPYIVPLSFGYERNNNRFVFYFHSAPEGRKISCIKKGEPVGFEMDTNYMLKEAKTPCAHSARFQSVIGTGTVEFITDNKDKEQALLNIMLHNTGKRAWEIPERALDLVAVFKLVVNRISCKEHD